MYNIILLYKTERNDATDSEHNSNIHFSASISTAFWFLILSFHHCSSILSILCVRLHFNIFFYLLALLSPFTFIHSICHLSSSIRGKSSKNIKSHNLICNSHFITYSPGGTNVHFYVYIFYIYIHARQYF